MHHPDQKYIDALLQNDMVMLHELYQKFPPKITWMVLQNNGTESDAADIFQEALLSVYNKAKTGQFILTCPLESFLYIVCKKIWLKELRKRNAQQVTVSAAVEYNEDANKDVALLAEECRLQQERKNLLKEKISELGENCRQLIRMSMCGKPMHEVAALLNMTYGYARKRKSECLQKLLALIKKSAKYNALKW